MVLYEQKWMDKLYKIKYRDAQKKEQVEEQDSHIMITPDLCGAIT